MSAVTLACAEWMTQTGQGAELPFLQACWDAPADDVPRLVYADWLDDHGHADRAELIRVQCSLARWTREHPDSLPEERHSVRHRMQQVLARVRPEWLRGLPDKWHYAIQFERGLPTQFIGHLGQVRAHWSLVLQRVPIFGVRLSFCPTEQAQLEILRLLEVPQLRSLGMSLVYVLEVDTTQWFYWLAHIRVENLHRLSLQVNYIDQQSIRGLCDNQHLAHLNQISFRRCRWSDEAIAVLSNANWPRLQELILLENDISQPAMTRLRQSLLCNALHRPNQPTYIQLNKPPRSSRWFRFPPEEPTVPTIGVNVGYSSWPNQRFDQYFNQSNFAILKRMVIHGYGHHDFPVEELLAICTQPQWRTLKLYYCDIASKIGRLFANEVMWNLQHFLVNYCPIDRNDLCALTRNRLVSTLKMLRLNSCQVDDAGLAILLSTNWPKLRRLELMGNSISSTMFAQLLSSPNLPALVEFDLTGSPLQGNASAWMHHPGLDRLRELRLSIAPESPKMEILRQRTQRWPVIWAKKYPQPYAQPQTT